MKILLLALSRSGHHAVLNWLIKQFKGSTIHYNNCELGWEDRELIPGGGRKVFYNEYGEIVKNLESPQNKAYSIETFDMEDYQKFDFDTFDVDHVVLVVRNFYNWIASSAISNAKSIEYEWQDYRGRTQPPTPTLWLKQAKELIGDSDIIKLPKTLISYDDWFDSEEYRIDICKQMNLSYSNKGLEEVPKFGDGSGFNGFNFDGNAQKMNVLNRWQSVAPELLEKFYQEDIDSLNKRIFNLSLRK
tara:strand:+ start:9736 stop:10470 length:735 start_codon:yes stop_codon:yes gene_type:complete